jgi:2-methylisocitrate lyase-like PEP mutase family enzyme
VALTPGARFRAALAEETPLQIVDAINATHPLMARQIGYQAFERRLDALFAGKR